MEKALLVILYKNYPGRVHSPDKKKKIDGSAMRNAKSKIAQTKPRKTHAKYLAEFNPRTKVPNSEIHLENNIQGSPTYIPYKKIPKCKQGCGKFGKKIIFPTSSSLEMPCKKHTPNKKEIEAVKQVKKLAAAKSDSESRKTTSGGKNPRDLMSSKAARKANPAGGGVKQPCQHKPGTVVLRKIRQFQKSVDLLIPLLSFSHLA